MDAFHSKKKKYCSTRSSNDLTEYARRQLKKGTNAGLGEQTQKVYMAVYTRSSPNLSTHRATHGKDASSSSNEVKANVSLVNLLDTDTFDSPVDTFLYEFFDSDDESDEICKINNLEDLIKSKEFFRVISLEVVISPGELLLMILKFCIVNHLPQTAMSNLIALINTIFVKPILPQSKYRLDKLFNPKDEAEFHATCPECSGYVGKLNNLQLNTVCDTCNTSIDLSKPSCENLFLIINPSIAIKEILENNADYYDYVVNKRVSEEHNIKDIFDGHMYRDFVNLLPDEDKHCYATTSFNTDGANRFKSSQFSAWPIYLMLHEIPPQDRFNNLITCGLWFNKKKPNMTLFLDPFVDVMNDVATTGIACTIKNKELRIKVFTLICCVDTVARAPAQGLMQFNAKYGCNWCLHPGLWNHGSMRYIITSEIIRERDVDSTLQYMKQSVEDPQYKPTFGIKNVSALINLKSFHIINGFVPDYMHCCLAGVGKQITNCLIAPNDVDYFQNLLKNIKSSHQITRLTRPLSDRNYWKCREWENWILYYSIPLLSFKIESKYVEYWSLFVESLHILLQTNISYAELDKADAMLHEFVFKTEQYLVMFDNYR